MKRRVYIICQKENRNKGRPQVIGNGCGSLEYIFYSEEGLKIAKHKVELMNNSKSLYPVHVRKATLIIEEEIKCDVNVAKEEQ